MRNETYYTSSLRTIAHLAVQGEINSRGSKLWNYAAPETRKAWVARRILTEASEFDRTTAAHVLYGIMLEADELIDGVSS